MRVMVDEAERCLEEGVVKSADEVDFALLSGTGFGRFGAVCCIGRADCGQVAGR
jgi:hypothetical protein